MNQIRCCSPYMTLQYLLFVQAALGSTCQDNEHFKSRSGRCCNLCLLGEYMERECSESHPTVCKPCPTGFFSDAADNSKTCTNCTKCEQVVVKGCTLTANAQCACKAGYLCANKGCSKCVQGAVCAKGKELQRLGDFDYIYECKNCSTNTYSDTEGGRCQNLTVCEKLGKKEISPGNSTQNTICGPIAPAPNGNNENLAPYLSVIIVAFSFIIVLLFSSLWMRNIKYITPMTKNQVENMLSCPLSKEEKGDFPIQAMDNKTSQSPLMEQSLSVCV